MFSLLCFKYILQGDRRGFISHLILCFIDHKNPVYEFDQQVIHHVTVSSSDDELDDKVDVSPYDSDNDKSRLLSNDESGDQFEVFASQSESDSDVVINAPSPKPRKASPKPRKPSPKPRKAKKRKVPTNQSQMTDFFAKKKK